MADFEDLYEDEDIYKGVEGGGGGGELSSDGEEMTEHDRAKFLRNIEKITKLTKTSKKRREVRKEASKDAAEFVAVKRKSGVAPTLNRLLESVKETGEDKAADKITKLVKAPTTKPVKTLETPLEKPQALKTKREVLYENAKKDVSRWNAIVYHNRLADQMVFPLNAGKKVPRKTGKDAAQDFVPMTPLEEEMAKVLYGEEYLKQKKALLEKPQGPTDSESYMLSVEEALANHSEMARLRALQSYQMTKAKRQNKIKSKKYHRLLRKEKIRKQLKEFESLQKTDPEAAMVKLEELDRSRVEERMSLKHRNTSKWAKMQAARAKYNKDSRMALSEQLKISQHLTQKVQESSSEDEDLDLNIPHLVKSSVDNPWMLRPEVKDNEKLQLYYTGYKKLWEDINEKKQKEIRKQEVQLDELREELNEEVVEKMQDGESFDVDDDAEAKTIEEIDSASDTPKNVATPNTPKTKGKKRKLKQKKKTAKQSKLDDDDEEENEFATLDIDSLMNKAEEKMRLKVEKELKELNKKERLQQKRMEKEKKRKAFREKKTKKQREGDADEIREFEVDSNEQIMESTNGGGAEERPSTDPGSKKKAVENTNTTKDQSPLLLNPNNFLKVKTSKTTTGSKFDGSNVNIDWDEEGDEVIAEEEDAQESQRMIIAEAFEDDDVVEEFKRMKESEIEASKPKDIDLHLPGWGEWGGKDLKPNPKRREKFIIKAPPQAPRKDAHLSHVILNQEAGERIREHQVRELPFPFKRVKDFERTVRAPIGRTWMPEASMKSLTAPKIITRLGSIIKPLDEDVLVKTKDGGSKDLKVPLSIKRLAKVKK